MGRGCRYRWSVSLSVPNRRPFSIAESASQSRGAVKGEERKRSLDGEHDCGTLSPREGGAPKSYRAFRPQGGEAARRPARQSNVAAGAARAHCR